MTARRAAEIARFLLAGGSTTVVSYAIYLVLLYLGVRYILAYPASFVAGVFWSYFINTSFVFKRRPSIRGLVAFPVVYVVQLIIGTATVHVAVAFFGLAPWAGPLIAIAASLPATYVLSRWVIRKTSTQDPHHRG